MTREYYKKTITLSFISDEGPLIDNYTLEDVSSEISTGVVTAVLDKEENTTVEQEQVLEYLKEKKLAHKLFHDNGKPKDCLICGDENGGDENTLEDGTHLECAQNQ